MTTAIAAARPAAAASRFIFRQLWDKESSTFTYLIADATTRDAVLIDPVLEHVERDAKLAEELGVRYAYFLNTHVHADHVTGSGLLKRKFPGTKSVLGLAGNDAATADVKLAHGEVLKFGHQEIELRSTPGHTQGCVSYVWRVAGEHDPLAVFTGDALLIRGCGRTDFQGGSAATLYKSVWEQILSLPPDTVVFPAHDYRGHTSSTVAEEAKLNPRLTKSEPDFIELMNNLKLDKPKLIDVAVPANRVCGLHEVGDKADGKLAAPATKP